MTSQAYKAMDIVEVFKICGENIDSQRIHIKYYIGFDSKPIQNLNRFEAVKCFKMQNMQRDEGCNEIARKTRKSA